MQHDLSRWSPWSRHQLPLLLCLIARLSDRRRLTPTIRVNVDIDNCAASLRGDLVLRARHRRTILPDPMNLNLELVRLPRCSGTSLCAGCSLVRQECGLREMLGGVEVPCKLLLLAGVLVRMGDLVRLGRSMVVDLRGVVEVLRMLRLQLAFVGVGSWTQHVLRKWPGQIHLRLDEGFGLLKIDLLGRNCRSSCILLLHLEEIVDLLVGAHCLPPAHVNCISRVVSRGLVCAARAEEALLLPLVRLQLLLRFDLELEGLLNLVGCGRGPMRLSEEGSWSRRKQSSVLQDSWANVQHLRLREVKPIDVEHSAWLNILLAIADHVDVPCLSATDPLLAELVVLLHLLWLQSKRAARSASRACTGGTAWQD